MMQEREWCKLSTNDRHQLREMALMLDSRRIYFNYSYDNPDYPPTIFAYCERKVFDSLLAILGLHRR